MIFIKKLLILPFAFCAAITVAQPVGYYNGTEGLKGNALKDQLNQIISGHYFYLSGNSNVWFSNKSSSYSNAKFVFLESDADPNIPGNVIDLYRGKSYNGDNYGTAAGTLNREHIWAKSHGNFPESSPMYCDYNNLRPSEASINRKKSNLDFDWTQNGTQFEDSGCYYDSDSWEPRDPVKGDVARAIFYMSTRYNGAPGEMNLQVVNSVNTYPQPKHGKLSALQEWNPRDLPDQFETNRNEVIYKYQGNRNPYIDNPYWIDMIWGTKEPFSVLIGNMSQTPLIATNSNPVEVSATISNASSDAKIRLIWGTSFDDLEHSIDMELESGRWIAQIPSQAAGLRIYLRVTVDDSETISESVCYNYFVYGTMPIAKIQGSGNNSPYEGETVSATGIVTATYSDGYYIQDDTNQRSGIYIYDSGRKPMIGNVVQVTGTVADYYGLTEIKNISSYELLQIKYPIPNPVIINTAQATKNYQSMFVKLINVQCTAMPDGSGNWQITDGSGSLMIHNNNAYSFTPTVGQRYDLQGVLNYSYDTWRIELRESGDVTFANNIDEEKTENAFSLYPNPSDNEIFIKIDKNIFEQPATIYISSIDGKLHYADTVSLQALENGHCINIHSLPAGIWIISLQSGNHKINKTFIIK